MQELVPAFEGDYNARFTRPPATPHDARRAVRPDQDLDEVFCCKEQRKLSGNPMLHYCGYRAIANADWRIVNAKINAS